MEKQRSEESEKRRAEERRSEQRKSEKKEDAGARKGSKVVKPCVFPMFCGSGGSKSRLAKAAGAEPCGQMRDDKLHAVVVRSIFRCQNVQNTSGSDYFWKLRCRKSARHGAKRISISKCTKHTVLRPVEKVHAVVARSTCRNQNVQNTTFRALLEVEMSKKCTPWRKARFQIKMCKTRHKTHHSQTTLGSQDVEKVHAVVARSTLPGQNWRTERFWTFRCRFAWPAQGVVHLVKSEQNVKVLQHFPKQWQAWDNWIGSAKMHFAWQAQYKRHVHQRCWEVRALISWEGLHFAASDLQFWEDDFVWQVQHFVWPGLAFFVAGTILQIHGLEKSQSELAWGRQLCTQLSDLSEGGLAEFASFLMLPTSKIKEISQTCFIFDAANWKNWGILAEWLRFQACR